MDLFISAMRVTLFSSESISEEDGEKLFVSWVGDGADWQKKSAKSGRYVFVTADGRWQKQFMAQPGRFDFVVVAIHQKLHYADYKTLSPSADVLKEFYSEIANILPGNAVKRIALGAELYMMERNDQRQVIASINQLIDEVSLPVESSDFVYQNNVPIEVDGHIYNRLITWAAIQEATFRVRDGEMDAQEESCNVKITLDYNTSVHEESVEVSTITTLSAMIDDKVRAIEVAL